MLGASGVAVLASRGDPESGIAGDEPTTTFLTGVGPICGYSQVGEPATTIEVFETSTTITWLDTTTMLFEPTTTPPLYPPTTLYAEGCTPSGQYRCVGTTGMDDQGYTYFEYCEPVNPGDSSFPYATTTTYPGATPVLNPGIDPAIANATTITPTTVPPPTTALATTTT